MPSKINFSFQIILILLLLISTSQSVFYRKIPFKYKSVVEKPWWLNTEEDNNIGGIITNKEEKDELEGEQNIAQLLEQIEKSSFDAPDEEIEEYNYNKLKEKENKLQKINNKLIKQKINKNGEEIIPKNVFNENEDNLPAYTHLMAFRPDYNIRNFASFLKRFLDTRIIAATMDDNNRK